LLACALAVLGWLPLHTWAKTPADAPPKSITVVLDDNYPPYVFLDASGQLQGILKDTWALWEARTGITVKLQAMDWAAAQKYMHAGRADVIDTLFITEARQQIYDFTAPYATLEVPLFFHHSIGGIVNAASLKGFTVGVKAGDACIDKLQAQGIDTLRPYPSYAAVVEAAANGDVRVFCMDKPPAIFLLNQRNIAKDFHYSVPLYTGQFHRAVRKGDTTLLKLVEDGFGRITAAEHQEIEKKWLGIQIDPETSALYLRYLAYALGSAALLTVLLGSWNLTLRQRVLARTSALTRSLDEKDAALLARDEALERLQKLTDRVPGMVYQYLLRPNGSSCFPYASASIQTIYGVSPEQAKEDAAPVFANGFPEELPGIIASINASAAQLSPWQYEYRVKRADGEVRWLYGNALPERLGDGSVLWHGFVTDITERRLADVALQTSLQEKVALLNEVHHRVKNNLQVITSLLRLEAGRSTQAATKVVLQDMQGRIRSMALLHESLYRAGNFAAIDLAAYLKQLATQAFRAQSNGAVRLQLALDAVHVSLDQATPCGLLVNELLSNGLKHAFPSGRTGELHVELHASPQPGDGSTQASAQAPVQSWRLCVSDNGVGLPSDFEQRRTQSLGLQLASDLARQLGGRLTIGPGPGNGTGASFAVVFVPGNLV
jgi:PAS domain S-box-containing protein